MLWQEAEPLERNFNIAIRAARISTSHDKMSRVGFEPQFWEVGFDTVTRNRLNLAWLTVASASCQLAKMDNRPIIEQRPLGQVSGLF